MKTIQNIIKHTLSVLTGLTVLYSCDKVSNEKLNPINDQEVPVYFNPTIQEDKSQLNASLNNTTKVDSTVIIDNSTSGLTIKATSKIVNNANSTIYKLGAVTKFPQSMPYMLYAYDKDGNFIKSKLMSYTSSSIDTMRLKPNATYTFVAYTHRTWALTGISYPNTIEANLSNARIRTNINTQDDAAVMVWKGNKLILPSSVTTHDNSLTIPLKALSSRVTAVYMSTPAPADAGGRTIQLSVFAPANGEPYLSPTPTAVDIDFQNQKIGLPLSSTQTKRIVDYSDNTTEWLNGIGRSGHYVTGYYESGGETYVNVVFTRLRIKKNIGTKIVDLVSQLGVTDVSSPTGKTLALKIPIMQGERVYASIEIRPSESILAQLD